MQIESLLLNSMERTLKKEYFSSVLLTDALTLTEKGLCRPVLKRKIQANLFKKTVKFLTCS